MTYQLAATAVALLHFGFVLFVVTGGLLLMQWRWLVWLHVPAVVWGVLIELTGWYCPLTRLENSLLRLAGRAGYSDGFIAHSIFTLIYPSGLTRGMEIALGVLVLAINGGFYRKAFR